MKAKSTSKSPKARTERAKPRSVQRLVSPRLATLKREIGGNIARYKAGVVKIYKGNRGTFMIERVKWKGTLPILNQCCGIPADALDIHDAKRANNKVSGADSGCSPTRDL